MRLNLSRCPSLGATLKLDIDITAVAMSNLPNEIVHWRMPMTDWYFLIPSASSNGESSSSGWSFFSSGDWMFCLGETPKMFL